MIFDKYTHHSKKEREPVYWNNYLAILPEQRNFEHAISHTLFKTHP
jgi:hypothetical protein